LSLKRVILLFVGAAQMQPEFGLRLKFSCVRRSEELGDYSYRIAIHPNLAIPASYSGKA
jgi:hypothetical protein